MSNTQDPREYLDSQADRTPPIDKVHLWIAQRALDMQAEQYEKRIEELEAENKRMREVKGENNGL